MLCRRILVGVLLAVPALALAGEHPQAKPTAEKSRAEMKMPEQTFSPKLERSNDLVGLPVHCTSLEKQVGSVQDVLIDPGNNRISYAVISFAKLTGEKNVYHAVPWAAVRLTDDRKFLQIDITEETLAKAPSFRRNEWPSLTEPTWTRNLETYYRENVPLIGLEARREAPFVKDERGLIGRMMDRPARHEPPERLTRVTQLVGMGVRNPQDEKIGTIEDVVIDLHEGRPVFVLVSVGGFLGIGERYTPVPWTALSLRPADEFARLDADREMVRELAYKPKELPDLANLTTARRFHEAFDRDVYWQVYGYVPAEPVREGAVPARWRAWMPNSEYNRLFSAEKLTTLRGTIASVGTFLPGTGAAEGLRLRVETPEGRTVTVHAGPRLYAESRDFALRKGDRVTITGAPAMMEQQEVTIASRISMGDRVLELRNQKGAVLWNVSDLSSHEGVMRSEMEE